MTVRSAKSHTHLYLNIRENKWSLHSLFEKDRSNLRRPYIILESMKWTRNSGKVIHTLKWNNRINPYKLGRGHEADVRVTNDISVSRLHMQLEYKKGNFIIKDLKSKFGTLVMARRFIRVKKDQHWTVQVGRAVMSFTVQDFGQFNSMVFNGKNLYFLYRMFIKPVF